MAKATELQRMMRFLDRNRTYRVGEVTIDTWFDKTSRCWITAKKDADGNQIGDAEISGDKVGAAHAHDRVITEVTEETYKGK